MKEVIKMSNYKKGDLVRVFDGSWTLAIENSAFRHAYGVELTGRDFEVLNTDLKLPSTDDGQFNTMIIKAKDNGQIVYIQDRMVKPVSIPKEEESITYNNITFIINEEADINKIMKELEKKLKMVSIEM